MPQDEDPAAPERSPAAKAAATAATGRDDLPPAARRALAEAEARRKAAPAQALPKEMGGRDGPEPVRYGDWELNGLAIDF